ncbi:hypothetical protein HDU85_007659 [Gaertneriomyces sp. JEL0708]|nr:hypothetical protein HDU85_007659 [Gaertneriomyces sp. JEL0708]
MYGGHITGTNNIPLGTRRKRADDGSVAPSHSPDRQPYLKLENGTASSNGSANVKTEDGGREGRPRKRRSRWGDESQKTTIPGVPTVLPSGMSPEQLDAFVIHMRLEEISQKLRIGYIMPPEHERSPSPEPFYGADGKRVNTREFRWRKKLEDERHKLVEEGLKKIPGFKPPADYKRPSKVSDKLYIPVKDYPEINFIGQLIGPRGTTLKRIESESGAKISIRGKGSVKEGKARADGGLAPGEEEDLHCLVTADSEEKVRIAMKAIEKVIETAASVPEGQNELKRMQLRYLAELNGTLRDDENQTCPNCGQIGHRRFDCPEQKNFTVNLVCRICNGVGHTARDCMQRNDPEAVRRAEQRDQKLDSEYANLMAELGEGGPGGANGGGPTGHYGPGRGPGAGTAGGRPPWAAGNSGAPGASGGAAAPPWAARRQDNVPPGMGAPAPWQQHDPAAPPPPGFGPPGTSSAMGPPGMAPPGMAPPGMGPPGMAAPNPWGQAAAYPPSGYDASAYGGYQAYPTSDYYGGAPTMTPGYAPPPPPADQYAPPPPPAGDAVPPPPPSDPAPPPPPSA